MHKEKIIQSIHKISQDVMPIGAKVILFGSQARNEAHEESDWDILILFHKQERVNNEDFDKMASSLLNTPLATNSCPRIQNIPLCDFAVNPLSINNADAMWNTA